MSENETVVIARHASAGQTLKPVFVYSREEYFDTPVPSQKSHQVSTLSMPRESPLISMPKNLPSYIMAGEHTVPNAQLVRRRIDYQETAEYRVVRPTGPITSIDGHGDAKAGLHKPLTVRVEEFTKRTAEPSSGSSISSVRRKSRVSLAQPTDRVLRSQNRKGVSVLQSNREYDIGEEAEGSNMTVTMDAEEEAEVTFAPLNSHARQAAIKRRVNEIEAEENAYSHPIASTTVGRVPPFSFQSTDATSARRPWHLSSMLGLSAEPAYHRPPPQFEGKPRDSNVCDTTSSRGSPLFASSVGRRVYSFLLNLIAIPLVLLHYLSIAVSSAGKRVLSTLSGLFQRTGPPEVRSRNYSGVYRKHPSTGSDLSPTSSRSKFLGYGGHHPRDTAAPLGCGSVSTCCIYSFLLLALLLVGTIFGFLFRSPEVDPALDDTPYFFGLLPSDAQCVRLARDDVSAHSLPDYEANYPHPLQSLRWNCLSRSLWQPAVDALSQRSSAFWNRMKSVLWKFTSPLTSSESPSQQKEPIHALPTVDNIDFLMERLKVIKEEMDNLTRQVNELKQANKDSSNIHAEELGTTHTNVSQLRIAVDEMKRQIAFLSDLVTGEDDQHQRRLIDELIKQAKLVSTTSLDAHLEHLRTHLEAMIGGNVSDLAAKSTDWQNAQIERFEKTLEELRSLVLVQKSDLENKLKTLKQELEAYNNARAAALEAIKTELNENFSSAVTESRSDLASLQMRLFADVEKISARISSFERLSEDLQEALRKLQIEYNSPDGIEARQQSAAKAHIEELVREIKTSFAENVALDLKQKIVEELTNPTLSGVTLQTKLIDLIRSTVDERLKEIFSAGTQGHTAEHISPGILTYIDSAFDVLSADRTGRADFALESAGGTVVSTRCTRTYTSFKSAVSLFGITLAYWSRSPNEILQPGNQPGECWCFHGSEGQAIVRLAMPVHVTGVSLEHIPKALSHTGRIDSAPRDFLIKALDSDFAQDGEVLGSFTYDEAGKPVQYFAVKARDNGKPTLFVELAITSNHGHPEYTCVYRLRVHGHMAPEADAK